jgi:DNA-binding transcriptional regulator LsrR (DeoR family)
MYFVEEKTQNEIAQHLGLGRVTVVRLLSDARERNEVKFSIEGETAECVELERRLESRFGIREAIVVPVSSAEADACPAISAATGMHLSNMVDANQKIGVGWGRTLWESLAYLSAETVPSLSIVSLLGGITKAKQFNPSEFAWRISNLFQAECYMMTAPAIVDSAATKQALIERCGLKEVFERARSLDAVLISVGDMDRESTPYRYEFVSEDLRAAMVEEGAVGEFLFNYFDVQGRPVKHPISERIMSIPQDVIAGCPERVIASGGVRKALALLGALRAIKPTVLVTDEFCARKVLDLAG